MKKNWALILAGLGLGGLAYTLRRKNPKTALGMAIAAILAVFFGASSQWNKKK